MGHLFISCHEAARRISRAQEMPLPARQRIVLWLHLAVCQFCRRYLRQVRFLRFALREYQEHLHETSADQLSKEAREQLLKKLRNV